MSTSAYTIYETTRQAWDAMYREIEAAQESIYWQVYIFIDDEIGTRFFEALERKAEQGIDVKLVLDYWGSFALSRKRVHQLRGNGVDVRLFQERGGHIRGFWNRFSVRTHRKVLVIDEKIGFIGGVNIDKNTRDWLDIHMRLRGTIVRSLLRSFARFYIRCGGPKNEVRHLLKRGNRELSKILDEHADKQNEDKRYDDFRTVYDQPRGNYSRTRKKYLEALARARDHVILFSPYYFPDAQFLKALWRAKKRGVRIDLLIPLRTDLRLATYAAYAWFAVLKKAGARIHLLKRMMHGKGIIVDDDWAMIGSSNIDHPSFYQNYEANIQMKDRRMIRKLSRITRRWMNDSKTLEEVEWHNRGPWQRFKEWLALRGYKFWFDID